MAAGLTQLIVLGMHRSGTSSVTRLLNLAGAWFGPDGIATEANEENPRGFWERRDVRAVCDGLLRSGGFDWWKLSGFEAGALPGEEEARWLAAFAEVVAEMDGHRPWVMKEPRLCLLLPVLEPVLSAPVCIHVTREPLEVAESVHRRNGLAIQGALALWELYTVRSFEASAQLPRVLVRYEDLMVDPVGTTGRLLGQLDDLGVEGLHFLTEADITSFISTDLHRQHRPASMRAGRLNEVQARLARRSDDGSVLHPGGVEAVSAGALEELAQMEETERLLLRLQTVESERDAQARQRDDMARYRDTEVARRREIGRLAEEALGGLDHDLERFARSRVGRLATMAMTARRLFAAGVSGPSGGPLVRPRAVADARRRAIHERAIQEPAPAPRRIGEGTVATGHPLIRRTRSRSPSAGPARPSVAVLAWDVGHNPLGRANVLAEVLARRFDVELWGAQFDRYGTDIWAPLRNAEVPINVFPGRSFPEHLRTMEQVVSQIDADAIWVSKPRLPSYLLGILAKQAHNRPLVLDVDDHELAFFGVDEGRSLREVLALAPDELALPFERAWTQACDPYIEAADQVTVSNVALQERYGGVIVGHARDETRFDPGRFDREQVRRQLGVTPDQRLLLFGGTPRAHKGVIEVLEALDRLGDPRNRVLMFGTREFDDLRPRIGDLARWAIVQPTLPFERLPELVVAADLACVVQDPTHPVSRYQMPAKVTDALAMGVPCIVSATPPLQPLIDAGVVAAVGPNDALHERISELLEDRKGARAQADRGRQHFLATLSYEAVAEEVAPMFERLLADPPVPSPRLAELAAATEAFCDPHRAPGARRLPPRRPRYRSPSAAPVPAGATYDVVMFWKQNDSDVYGRRQDMFLQELRRSARVGTIVHFDNPISPEELAASYRAARGVAADQRRLVATETVARVLHRRDEPGVIRRTFVFGSRYSRRVGWPRREAYVDYVRRVLDRSGIGSRPLIAWAYPSNDDLPALLDAIEPAVVVADVVDDNRTWYAPGEPLAVRIEANYRAVLGRSDVVIANCEPVAASMSPFAADINVVPNGLELPSGGSPGPRPAALRGVSGPVLAYVGNLSGRLDLALLDAVARARPDWNLYLVGSAHLDRSVLALDQRPNVHFLGVMPHREAQAFLRHVDVALIPHLDDDMTRSMNPLKAFVYASAGVPVVSTPVANLPDFGDLITVASGPEEFVVAIEAHLGAGRPGVDLERLRPHTWERRLQQVFDLVDAAVAPTDERFGVQAGRQIM